MKSFKSTLALLVLTALCISASGQTVSDVEKAYIFIGDIEPTWYSTLVRSALGEVDPKNDLQQVINAQKQELESRGYDVKIIDLSVESDLKSALNDPTTKAVVWFGHGDSGVPGTINTAQGELVTPGDILEWAQEQLAEEIGTPDTWSNLPAPERRDLFERWQNAHFNLAYAYFHTCYGMKNNDLVDVLMEDSGEFRGYTDTAWLSDTSTRATTIRGRSLCSWSGEWSTTWGTMKLQQSGEKVTGTYPWNNGRVQGEVSGDKFIGTWSEKPTYSAPDDAGNVVLYLSDNCNSFSGSWMYGFGSGVQDWDGIWSGTREKI